LEVGTGRGPIAAPMNPAPVMSPPVIVALMIGELPYMSGLNRISTRIVERSVEVWRQRPGGILVCESQPMSHVARGLGVPDAALITALPQASGHTTRLVADWLAGSGHRCSDVLLVTHALHAPRAVRVFAKLGIAATAEGLDLAFDRHDPDWKLRSRNVFQVYNFAAHIYCVCRGWV
jgi:hypothetical protein